MTIKDVMQCNDSTKCMENVGNMMPNGTKEK